MKHALTFLAALLLTPLATLHAAAKPRIVFILLDDMPRFGTPVRMDAAPPESAMAFPGALGGATQADAAQTLRVYFIGNSVTDTIRFPQSRSFTSSTILPRSHSHPPSCRSTLLTTVR